MYTGPRVKCPLFLKILMKREVSEDILEKKFSNIKFQEIRPLGGVGGTSFNADG